MIRKQQQSYLRVYRDENLEHAAADPRQEMLNRFPIEFYQACCRMF